MTQWGKGCLVYHRYIGLQFKGSDNFPHEDFRACSLILIELILTLPDFQTNYSSKSQSSLRWLLCLKFWWAIEPQISLLISRSLFMPVSLPWWIIFQCEIATSKCFSFGPHSIPSMNNLNKTQGLRFPPPSFVPEIKPMRFLSFPPSVNCMAVWNSSISKHLWVLLSLGMTRKPCSCAAATAVTLWNEIHTLLGCQWGGPVWFSPC